MSYKVKTGSNQSLVSLTDFAPQPSCEGLQYTAIMPMADRSVDLEGGFFVFVWDSVTVTEYGAILTLAGLSAATKSAVTVYGPSLRYGQARYNANVYLPLPGQEVARRDYFIRGINMLFTDLVEL